MRFSVFAMSFFLCAVSIGAQVPVELQSLLKENQDLVDKMSTSEKDALIDQVVGDQNADQRQKTIIDSLEQKTRQEKIEPVEKSSVEKHEKEVESRRESEEVVDQEKTSAEEEGWDFSKIFGRAFFADFGQGGGGQVSIPDDYVLGTGDQVLLRTWGRINDETLYTVEDDGSVQIDIFNNRYQLRGMSYRAVKKLVSGKLADMSGVQGDVRVVSSRSIRIRVSGFASHPGVFMVPPYSTFWQALQISGGPSDMGSLRRVTLLRKGREVSRMDLYRFLQNGKYRELTLQNDDVLHFSSLQSVVQVKELARTSGLFELLPGEKLGDLVKFAGGLQTGTIADYVQIERITRGTKGSDHGQPMTILEKSLVGKSWKKMALQDGDVVRARKRDPAFDNELVLLGRGVFIPGRHSFLAGEATLGAVLNRSGGFRPGALEKVEVVRRSPDGRHALTLTGLEAIRGFSVERGDTIYTFHENDFREYTLITLDGPVRKTLQVLWADGLTLSALLRRVQGLQESALPYVLLRHQDDVGNIRWERVELGDAADAKEILPRDQVFAFDALHFRNLLPVTVLYPGREPMVLEYSDDLDLEVVTHRLQGVSALIDSSMVELAYPDFSSVDRLVAPRQVKLNAGTLQDKSMIRPGLLIIFRNDPKKLLPRYFHVLGEVLRPGRFVLNSRVESVASALEQAGGVNRRANRLSMTILRKGVSSPIPIPPSSIEQQTKETIYYMNDGDTLIIKRDDRTVEVLGSVLNPGTIPFIEGMDWEDYIDQGAGGSLDTAAIEKTYIIYPNGVTKKANAGWFHFDPEVPSGSRIVVPEKPYIPPNQGDEFDYREFMAGLNVTMAILTSLLTVVILSKQ